MRTGEGSCPTQKHENTDPSSSFPPDNHVRSWRRQFISAWLSTDCCSPCCLPYRSASSSPDSAQTLWFSSVSLDSTSSLCVSLRVTQKTIWNRIYAARASGLRGRNPIRMAFQTTSRCGFGLICKNRISCIFGCHDIQKSILFSQKMDLSWQAEHMLQVKQVYSELLPFSFCAQNTWNNLLNVLHSSTHYPWTIQEDLRNTVFYNSCQWALFFWNTLDIFVHPDIFPNEGNLDFWGLSKSLESFECFVVWNAAGVNSFHWFPKALPPLLFHFWMNTVFRENCLFYYEKSLVIIFAV